MARSRAAMRRAAQAACGKAGGKSCGKDRQAPGTGISRTAFCAAATVEKDQRRKARPKGRAQERANLAVVARAHAHTRSLSPLCPAFAATIATFAQGCILGGLLQGITVENNEFAGGIFDWLTPFSLFCGAGLGWNAAAGGMVMAHDFAVGAVARAAQANTQIANQFFQENLFFRISRIS